MTDKQEILDLVDENDSVFDTITREDANTLTDNSEKQGYIRASDMFLINDKGEFWVPKRTADKRLFPNGLDFSVGGHVESGEDYLTTILRETEEEINLKLKPEDVTLVNVQRIDENRYFNALFIYRTNETPDFNTDDFASAEWLSPLELLTKIEQGTPAKTNIKLAVKRILESGKYN
jgi:isopentenyldiphosphate isomerase